MPSSHRSTTRAGASSFHDQETELLPVIDQGPREFEFFDNEPAEDPAEPLWVADRETRHHRDVTFRRSEPGHTRGGARNGRQRLQTLAALGVRRVSTDRRPCI